LKLKGHKFGNGLFFNLKARCTIKLVSCRARRTVCESRRLAIYTGRIALKAGI